MSGRLFWLTVAALLGIAVHISYVLFVPRVQMDAKMSEFTRLAGTNHLVVVQQDALESVLPEADPSLVHAVCVFDLSAGPIVVKAKVPIGYWLISFYAPNGDGFYSLNNRQADVRNLDLVVIRKSDASSSDTAAEAQAGADNQITVRSPSLKGLVVLRARIATPAMLARVRADLAASQCVPAT